MVAAQRDSGYLEPLHDPRPDAEEDRQEAETNYLAGLRTPTTPPRKQRVLNMEVSTGSSDRPRLLRFPVDQVGVTEVRIRMELLEEEDQDGIETQLLPGAGLVQPVTGPTSVDLDLQRALYLSAGGQTGVVDTQLDEGGHLAERGDESYMEPADDGDGCAADRGQTE